MSCDPFHNSDAIVSGNWHNKERRKIFLKDGTSHPYVAVYDGDLTFSAFVVDKGLLPLEHGKKMCDNMLLKCPTRSDEGVSNGDGVAYFIEMKTQNDIHKGYLQLKESYDRLRERNANWMNEYKIYFFRICYKSKTTNITDSSNYRALRTVIPKGLREEIVIKIDNFATNPEMIR